MWKKIKMEHVYSFMTFLKQYVTRLLWYNAIYVTAIGALYLECSRMHVDFNIMDKFICNGAMMWLTVSMIVLVQTALTLYEFFGERKRDPLVSLSSLITAILYACLIKEHTSTSVWSSTLCLVILGFISKLTIEGLNAIKALKEGASKDGPNI